MTPSPHHRRFHDESGNRVAPGQKLGEGGEGAVYLVEGDSGSVMKIWHPDRTPQDADAKLRHMIANPVEPDLGATWQIAWPQHLVQESGVTVGYTMPLLDSSASWEPIVEYYNRRAAQNTEQEQGRELRVDDRVRMATNLALGFRAVHAAGYVIGDVNEKNVEVNRQNDIAMVDCDSYGFTDPQTGRSFSNHMGRAEFQPPEAQDDYANRTQNHDRFGLAVIIFHLLTGYHPYTVTNQPDHPQPGDRIRAWLFPPSNRAMVEAPEPYDAAWEALTDGQQELFARCFDWQYQGQPRPTPEEWVEALQEMPEEVTPPTIAPTGSSTQGARSRASPAAGRRYQPPPVHPAPTAYRVPPPAAARQAPATPAAATTRRRPRWRTVLIGAAALFIAYVSCNLIVMVFEDWRAYREERQYARWYEAATADSTAGVAAAVQATIPPVPTDPLIPTEPPTMPVTASIATSPPTPVTAPTPAASATPAPTEQPLTPTPAPPATPSPAPTTRITAPLATPTPAEWLYPNPTHPLVAEAANGTELLVEGCYLGNVASARRFRLASWDVWDPSRYGQELKFVKIITNNGHQIPLERGACYSARVIKHANSAEEYVCLDADAKYPQQFPCNNSRQDEVIPAFVLHPNDPENPADFTDNFVRIRVVP